MTRAAFGAIRADKNDLNVARKERTALLDPARERMVQYRAAVEGLLGPKPPLTQSLPALSPAPGSTPDASTPTENRTQRRFWPTWHRPRHPIRTLTTIRGGCRPARPTMPGTAEVVTTVPSNTLSLNGTTRLENPGDIASFRVFVKVTNNNEAESNLLQSHDRERIRKIANKKSDLHYCKSPKTRQQPTFALFCTIIGHVSLTVVFEMGTCVSSRVASPDIRL